MGRPVNRGFTLIELMVVLLVMAILASGLAIPLAAQLNARRAEDARRQLAEVRDALLGFAAAQGRLPCPAIAAGGEEAFAPGGDPGNGECATFGAGFVPGTALGIASPGGEGFVRDPWEGRLRYAVASSAVNGVTRPFTRSNGAAAATLPALGAASRFLIVCSSGSGATGSGCGAASMQLTRRAVFVLLSTGPNGGRTPAAASDEARNLDGNGVFVARENGIDAGGEFDDVVAWVSLPLLVHRLLAAGRLP